MKKYLILTLAVLTFLWMLLLAGCTLEPEPEKGIPAVNGKEDGRLQVVATLFPQYDFARQIAGEKAEVTLLLPPGVESHSYEPTPSDIIKINQSDLFLYTGKAMEVWSQKIIDGMQDSGSSGKVLDLSRGIQLDQTEGVEDPHFWTDPVYAQVMTANIRDALCSIDPDNGDYYRKNADGYLEELKALDQEFREIANSGTRKEILFGSRFALHYFAQRYGLSYKAAFDSCSSETEPSARTVAGLIEEIKEKQIPVIYYAELEDPKVARSISTETGAKMLLLHSCHNVTKAELESGATYLSLMKQNAENLKEGLK